MRNTSPTDAGRAPRSVRRSYLERQTPLREEDAVGVAQAVPRVVDARRLRRHAVQFQDFEVRRHPNIRRLGRGFLSGKTTSPDDLAADDWRRYPEAAMALLDS